MRTEEFDYCLPPELIAQVPLKNRHDSRLMVYSRSEKTITHSKFKQIRQFLKSGDVLVINTTRVLPARLFARKPSGGKVEILLLRKMQPNQWEALAGGKRIIPGMMLRFNERVEGEIIADLGGARRVIQFNIPIEPELQKLGEMPLPPYIHEPLRDRERYQTVFAQIEGSAAAPTAGLHFTHELMDALQKDGLEFARVLLHVGLDTFAPVTEENIEEHEMHTEWCQIEEQQAEIINRAKREKRRIIAVGTTSARTLESVAVLRGDHTMVQACEMATDLYIYPGYKFKMVDGLITNFHLPKSTLLMLVSAFAGMQEIRHCYQEAIQERYRFYSFGDAMLIE